MEESLLLYLSLELAKSKFRGQLAQGSQTASQRAERRVQLRGLGLKDNHDKESDLKLDLFNSKDLKEIAEKHLKNPLLSLCGPTDTINKLAKIWN